MFADVWKTSNVCHICNLSVYTGEEHVFKTKARLFSRFGNGKKFLWNVNWNTSTWAIAKWRKPVSKWIIRWWNWKNIVLKKIFENIWKSLKIFENIWKYLRKFENLTFVFWKSHWYLWFDTVPHAVQCRIGNQVRTNFWFGIMIDYGLEFRIIHKSIIVMKNWPFDVTFFEIIRIQKCMCSLKIAI